MSSSDTSSENDVMQLRRIIKENPSEGNTHMVENSRWRRVAQIMFGNRQSERGISFVFDPDSTVLFYWMGAMALATLYNAWISALRIAFPEIRQEPIPIYLQYLDIVCDSIYAVDIVVQLRTAFLQDGIPVFNPSEIRKYYSRQTYFVHDLISAFPSEIVFSLISARLTKLFKFHVLYRFYDLAESRTSNPYVIRVFRLSLSLAVIIHWVACSYYLASEYEGLGSNDWVYTSDPKQQNFRRKYIICLYWSIMILTTIGNTNSPETDLEYIFTGVTFLIGVFVFATVLGNVGDVISSMNANRQEFQARMDHIKMYLTHKKVPASLQLKIKKWAEYSWSRTKATDESRLLNILPERLRAEVAVHVHLDNLKKVKIFEKCETGFLCELVLKLRSQVYSPGDYICKAGETGREMFIINHGKVEVLVPNPSTNKDMVVAILGEGDYFGEISLLRLDGVQNRRTADVRSIGYSELLCLSRKDLMSALVEYPEAKSVLESQAKRRMKTSLQAQRAFSVDTLLRNSQEYSSFESLYKEENRGRDVTEIKAMIEELKSINKVPGKTIWQLIARCELLQEKVREKEKETQNSRQRIQDLEQMIKEFRAPSPNSPKFGLHAPSRSNQKIVKQLSQDEERSHYYQSTSEFLTSELQEKLMASKFLSKEDRKLNSSDNGYDQMSDNALKINTQVHEVAHKNLHTIEQENEEKFSSKYIHKNDKNTFPSFLQSNLMEELNHDHFKLENHKKNLRGPTLIRVITEEDEEEENEASVSHYENDGITENVSRYLKRNSEVFTEGDLKLEQKFYDSARRQSTSQSDGDEEDILKPSFVSIVTDMCKSLEIEDGDEENNAQDNNLLGLYVEMMGDEYGSGRSSKSSACESDKENESSDE